MAWPEKIESTLSCGIALHNRGINNWALTKEQALLAFEEFERHKVAVLGGDVYELVDGCPEPNYDNWYCDRNDGESLDDFVHRSIDQARHYVCNYNNIHGRDTFFILVGEGDHNID